MNKERIAQNLAVVENHFHGEALSEVEAALETFTNDVTGPVKTLDSDFAKVFASCYALFSGVVFISATGILLAPMFHRVLHRFHIEQRDFR